MPGRESSCSRKGEFKLFHLFKINVILVLRGFLLLCAPGRLCGSLPLVCLVELIHPVMHLLIDILKTPPDVT